MGKERGINMLGEVNEALIMREEVAGIGGGNENKKSDWIGYSHVFHRFLVERERERMT